MKKIALAKTFVLLLLTVVSSHLPVAAADLDRLAQRGIAASQAGASQKDLDQLLKGLAQAQKANNFQAVAGFLNQISSWHEGQGQYDQAAKYLEQLLDVQKKLKDAPGESGTLNRLALSCQFTHRFREAVTYYQQALALKRANRDSMGEVAVLLGLGGVYSVISQYDQALGHLEQAQALVQGIKNPYLEYSVIASMASVYMQMGDYENYLSSSEQQLKLSRKIGNRNFEAMALLGVGLAHSLVDQNEEALRYYEQALALTRQLKDRRGEAAAYVSLGMLYKDKLGQPEKAQEALEKYLAITRELQDLLSESAALNALGALFNDLHRYDQALGYYEQDLAVSQKLNDPMAVSAALLGIGMTYENLGKYEAALPPLQKTLDKYKQLDIPFIVWLAQRTLGKVQAGMGRYPEAISYYEQAIDTLESIRAGIGEDRSKTSFVKNKLFVYDELIELLRLLHERFPSQGYDRKSWEIFERKQGRAFLEEVGKTGARNFARVPLDLRDKEADLESRLTEARSRLAAIPAGAGGEKGLEQIRLLQAQIEELKTARQALKAEIQKRAPEYYALKYPRPASLADLQGAMRGDEMVLAYGVMDRSTCLWVIGKEKFVFIPLAPGEKEWADRVNDFRQGLEIVLEAIKAGKPEAAVRRIAQNSQQNLNESGRRLMESLLPDPVQGYLAGARTLYIIPTGPLYALPFEALITAPPTSEKPAAYLVDKFAVAYLSSASLLKTLRQSEASRRENGRYPLLAFADPVYQPGPDLSGRKLKSGSSKKKPPVARSALQPSLRTRSYQAILGGAFTPLPDTAAEAKEIKGILQAPESSHPLQLQKAASRSNVLRLQRENLLEKYRYVIFSCHGVLPGEVSRINQPGLVLSHPDPHTKTEGYLTMADVLGLKLNADLVTLSACNSGRGRVEKGEGVMGLTRAFMFAGTPAISVTLWSVESNAAKLLATGLYKNLRAGKNKAEALRLSKLELIRGKQGGLYSHPFFWAPMVLFGEVGWTRHESP